MIAVVGFVTGIVGIIIGIIVPGYLYKMSTKDLVDSTRTTARRVEMVIRGLEQAGLIKPVRNDKGETTGFKVELSAHGIAATTSGTANLTVTTSEQKPDSENLDRKEQTTLKGTAILSDDGMTAEFRDNNWSLIKTFQHGDAIEIFDHSGWLQGTVINSRPNQWSVQVGRTNLRVIDFPNPPAGFVARIRI
jgi:hypothetical protein